MSQGSLNSLRIRRGLSVSELARTSGLARSTVIKILEDEGATSRPHIVARVRMALGSGTELDATLNDAIDRIQDNVGMLQSDIAALDDRAARIAPEGRKGFADRLRLVSKRLDSLRSTLNLMASRLQGNDRDT